MSSFEVEDLALLVLRAGLGFVLLAHGYNHIFGGGKITGTARWFESLGMKPGIVHAWSASFVEIGAGVMLLIGFATPLACAGVLGTMLVAWITNHLRNGFFIFRPGEGYEYVMTLCLLSVGLAGMGPGRLSVDHGLSWFYPLSWWGFALTLLAGIGGATGLLMACWRPESKAASAASQESAANS